MGRLRGVAQWSALGRKNKKEREEKEGGREGGEKQVVDDKISGLYC